MEKRVESAEARAEQEQARAEQAFGRVSSAILMILRVRGLAVDESIEQRVLGCSDLEALDRWLQRAASVASAAELFIDS